MFLFKVFNTFCQLQFQKKLLACSRLMNSNAALFTITHKPVSLNATQKEL